MRIAVQWPRLGPLHLNRLRAAHDALHRHGMELVAIETASDSRTYAWRVEQDPVSYRRVTVFPGQTFDDIPVSQMHAQMMSALDDVDPDGILVHSYSLPDARAALSWCRENRRVAILMAESKADDSERKPWREGIKKVLVSQFDAAVASGSRSTDYAVSLGMDASKIFRGYSVVDNEFFAREAAAVRSDRARAAHLPELRDPRPFFFASARFMRRKNLDTLLTAYGSYRRNVEDPWRLVLLGDGELRPELEKQIAEEGIPDVSLPGWRQIEELPLYYGLAAAFVHTADVDQWGLVINEAMAAGLPVICSTGTGAAHDLVAHGVNGFRFQPRDAETLTLHMRALAHEVDLDAFGNASRQIIQEWPLSLFGDALAAAFQAGEVSRDRGLSVSARAILFALRKAARKARAFHSVED